jgi:YHS domain-containing protein
MSKLLSLVVVMLLLSPGLGSGGETKGDKEEMIVCPVLKQKIPKKKAIKVVHGGKTYYVCCDTCAEKIKSGKFKPK